MAKGFLERMGLVERVEDEIEVKVDMAEYSEEPEEEIEVETDNVSEDNFVTDVYTSNGLSDLSKSIFKVEEISKNLPATMPTDTMKASVIGILASFQLTAEDVIADGQKRQEIINAALRKISEENEALISIKQAEIEEAKKLIEECEKTIAACKQLMKVTEDKVEAESIRIQRLVDFVTVEPEGESK